MPPTATVFGSRNPKAILRAADLPVSQIATLLDNAPAQHLHSHILHASRIIDSVEGLINNVSFWNTDWDQLISLEAINSLRTQCILVRAQIDAYAIEELKSTVLGIIT